MGEFPAVAGRRLRLALRQAREAKQLTLTEVPELLDWSLPKVNGIESGEVTVSSTDLQALQHLDCSTLVHPTITRRSTSRYKAAAGPVQGTAPLRGGRPEGKDQHLFRFRVALPWRKSRRCDSGNCIEVARNGEFVLVRDSTHPDGPTLRFHKSDWDAFIAGLRAGRPGRGRSRLWKGVGLTAITAAVAAGAKAGVDLVVELVRRLAGM